MTDPATDTPGNSGPDDAGDDVLKQHVGAQSIATVGTQIDTLTIDVDYEIIRHFSERLYGSPHKAIEELVANAFDAMASEVRIYVPGDEVQGRIIVWDNGQSMDTSALKQLWWIARSPRDDGGERVNSARLMLNGKQVDTTRLVIGKFGIGKLASYTLGHRLTYLCHLPAGDYAVTVDYRLVTNSASETAGAQKAPPAAIRQLSPEGMRSFASSLFRSVPSELEQMLSEPTWTMAVVDELKGEREVKLGILRRVLSMGMPLREDFRAFINDIEVTSKQEDFVIQTWDLSLTAVRDSIQRAWNEEREASQVSGEILAKSATADERAHLIFPNLGKVFATVRIFSHAVTPGQSPDDRSHGFFVKVRRRLINATNDKLFLNDPSYSTFYRAQWVIEADALDEVLLADRERLREETPMTAELTRLQLGLYRAARAWIESDDVAQERSARAESLLPTHSRDLFVDAVAALAANQPSPLQVDLSDPQIERAALEERAPIAQLDATTGHFLVNTTHPFYVSVEKQAGGGAKGRAVMRAFDLLMVCDRLTEGRLYQLGLKPQLVRDLFDWRDKLFRALAVRYDKNADGAVQEARASSYKGDRPFEVALAAIFSHMGFVTFHDGASGRKDVLVVAPTGPSAKTFIVEAKGGIMAKGNDDLDIADAAAHRDDVAADHAVIIARDFAGFERLRADDPPQTLKALATQPNVSIADLETVILLLEAVRRYSYPLDDIMEALFVVEGPKAKRARVSSLMDPLEQFDYREVLDDIWERQQKDARGDYVPARTVWQGRQHWRAMEFSVFLTKVVALQALAAGLMDVNTGERLVVLRQSPENIAARIASSLEMVAEPGVDHGTS